MASPKSIELSEIDLQCPICSNVFTDPRLLSCLHTYCFTCLERYVTLKQKENQPVTCPLCRKVIDIPQNDVKNVSVNHHVENLIHLKSQNWVVPCDNCVRDGATFECYCADCHLKLCSKCEEFHRVCKSTLSHKIVTKTAVTGEQLEEILKNVVVFCKLHRSEQIKMYCFNCKQLICLVCKCSANHENHRCLGLSETRDKFEGEFHEKLQNIESKISPHEKLLSDIDKVMATLSDQIDNIIKEIDATTEIMIKRIKEDSEKLKTELKQLAQQQNKEMSQFKEDVELSTTKFKSFIKFANDLKSFGSDIDVINLSDKLNERADELSKLKLPVRNPLQKIIYQKNEEYLNEDRNILGNIVPLLQGEDVIQHTLSGSQQLQHLMPQAVNVAAQHGTSAAQNVDQHANYRNNLCLDSVTPVRLHRVTVGPVRGITEHNNELFVVCWNSNQITVLSTQQLSEVRTIKVNGLTDPSDIIVSKQINCLFISDYNNALFRVDLINNEVKRWTVKGGPFGLSTTNNGLIIVCCVDDHTIKLFTTEGHVQQVIQLHHDIRQPQHCVHTSNNTLLVCTHNYKDNQRVVCRVTLDGQQVLQVFGSTRGSDEQHLSKPEHLCITSDEHVLVTDCYNKRIVLLNKDLSRGKQFIKTEHRPQRTHLNETKQLLYVVDWFGFIRVYQL